MWEAYTAYHNYKVTECRIAGQYLYKIVCHVDCALLVYLNKTEQNRTKQNRTEQNRTEQDRTNQNRTEQDKEQNKTEHNKT